MSHSSQKRNIYIDIMKGLLITLVVIGHLQYFEYDSRTLILIYSFHMHAFLIIGGLLSHINENSKFSTVLFKRVKGTLIPYFIFYIISFIIVPTFSNEQRLNALKVVIYGIGIPPDQALNLPLWFLTFYFVVMTLFEIIQIFAYRITNILIKIKTNNIRMKQHNNTTCENSKNHNTSELQKLISTQLITLFFISIIMYFSFRYARIHKLKRLPYNIEIAGFCLGFVYFGNILSKTIPNLFRKIKKFINKYTLKKVFLLISSLVIIMCILITWYKLSMRNGRIDLNARDYKNAFYMYIDAILGFILFAIFSYMTYLTSLFAINKLNGITSSKNILSVFVKFFYLLLDLPSKLFSYLGKNSLYILAYHVPSVFYTWAYIIPLFPLSLRQTLSHNSIISIIIMSFLGIVFSLLISLSHKVLKFLFNKVSS